MLVFWVNSQESKHGRGQAFQPRAKRTLEEDPARSSNDPPPYRRKHYHVPEINSVPTPVPPDRPAPEGCTSTFACPVSAAAFREASLFRPESITFAFYRSTSYECEDVADFAAHALQNRARSINTLKRVTAFVEEFHKFATLRTIPQPIDGGESLLAIALWLGSLRYRGATTPNIGRYDLRAFGEALGVRLPLERPAVRSAATDRKGRKVETAPLTEAEFVLKIEQLASDKNAPGGKRLYGALFTLLALYSPRFGDTKQVEKIFDSGSAIVGVWVNNKDKTGELMTWATPLVGLSGNRNWAKPIFDLWNRIVGKTKGKPGRFRALFPFAPPSGILI